MNKKDLRKIADAVCKLIFEKRTKDPEAYDTTAEVRRIENGKAYVHIPGGIDETPVDLTIDASAGDTVQVRVSGGRAWLVGNKTAPPTDDTEALVGKALAKVAGKVADKAYDAAEEADTKATAASSTASSALTQAQAAKQIADDTEQHFWFQETGGDTGAHITEVTQEEWSDAGDPNYHSGGNLLARSNGIAVRDGMTELASFGSSEAIIGDQSDTNVKLNTNGLQFYNATVPKFTIDYNVSSGTGGKMQFRESSAHRAGVEVYGSAGLSPYSGAGLYSRLGANAYASISEYAEGTTEQILLKVEDGTNYNYVTIDKTGLDITGNVAKYKINGVALAPSDLGEADYIIEKGKKTTSGTWYYEKWASGKIEAWGANSTGTLTMSASGSMYRATGVSVAIASGIFSSTPTYAEVFSSYSSAVFVSASASPANATSLSCLIWKATNATASVDLKFHVVYYPSNYA